MNTSSISPISMFISFIVTIILGFFMIFNPSYIENFITGPIQAIIISVGILSIITYIFNRRKKHIDSLVSGILYICLGIFIKHKIGFIEISLVVTIGIYAFINFTVQFIASIILYNNNSKRWIGSAISTVISLISALLLIFYPIESKSMISKIAGIYLILYGLTIFKDFIREILDKNIINDSLKRKIRVRLPVIYTAFIPQKLLEKINSSLKTSSDKVFTYSKGADNGEVEIFIHLSKDMANGFGHVDICFRDKIYSYGTYDASSNRLFKFVSDGVLVEADRNKYINFATKKSHLVSFVLSLDSIQYDAIEKKIEEIKKKSVRWHCDKELNNDNNYLDNTSVMYMDTNCKFYKFKSGYFKTYFVFTTNCVKLADAIIGSAGIDTIAINGIITPGIYFNFLNNLFKMNNSVVVRRNMYKKSI